jgi:hypothetical protein
VPFNLTGKTPTLWDLHALAVVEGQEISLVFDFRLIPAKDLVETRVPVEDGHVIAVAGVGSITIHATNGTFSCSRETSSCTAESVVF